MDGKKRKKKELEPAPGLTREVAGTMYGVGGREREGKPPKLWSNFGHGFKTLATGAVDSIAPRIPPDPVGDPVRHQLGVFTRLYKDILVLQNQPSYYNILKPCG